MYGMILSKNVCGINLLRNVCMEWFYLEMYGMILLHDFVLILSKVFVKSSLLKFVIYCVNKNWCQCIYYVSDMNGRKQSKNVIKSLKIKHCGIVNLF